MARAAIYRRVSTRSQSQEDRFSLAEQSEKTHQRCKEKGYDIVADFEEVYSGAELITRPKINELLDMVARQQVDVVVLTTLDRLSRDQTHQTVILYRIEEYGARIELTEEVFEDSPQGKIMRTMTGIFAEMERAKILERTVRGKRQRVREGYMIPGKLPLYGYNWADEKKSRYVINPKTAPIAVRIWNEAAAGKPLRRIAADLNSDSIDCPSDAWRREKGDPNDPPQGRIWLRSVIRSLLHNPTYWGEYSAFRWDSTGKRKVIDPISGQIKVVRESKQRELGEIRTALPQAAPALVSPELARQVHERLTQNKAEALRNNKRSELSLLRGGYIKCDVCHGNMICSMSSHGRVIYRCSRGRIAETSGRRCENTSMITATMIDTAVWNAILTVLQNPEYFEQEMVQRIDQDNTHGAVAAISRQVKELEAQAAGIARAIRYAKDEIATRRLVVDLEAVEKELQRAKDDLAKYQKQQLDQDAVREQLKSVKELMYAMAQAEHVFTYPEKRAFLYMLNIRVNVKPFGAEIRYTITAGKHGEVRLPLSHCGNDCDAKISILFR